MHLLESRYFNHGGTSIHYQVRGHGPVPIVFLHGFASAHDTWHDLAPHFPPERFSIYLVDLKGFGRSSVPRDGAYAVKDQARVVRAFLAGVGLSAVTLVGHSMGGAVALHLCLHKNEMRDPFDVERLVLIGCAAYPQRLPKFLRRLKSPLGPLFLRLMPARKMALNTLQKVYFDQSAVTAERVERYARYFRGRGKPYALRTTVRSIDLAERQAISEQYGRLKLPTMIIWGVADCIVKLKNAHRLHGDIPGSRLKLLDACGHTPHEERPAEIYAAIEAFVNAPSTEST